MSIFANFLSGSSITLYFDDFISDPGSIPSNRYYLTLGKGSIEANLGTKFLSAFASDATRFTITVSNYSLEIKSYGEIESDAGSIHHIFDPWSSQSSIPYDRKSSPPYVRISSDGDASLLILYSPSTLPRNYSFILPLPQTIDETNEYAQLSSLPQTFSLFPGYGSPQDPKYIKSIISSLPPDTIYIYHPFTTSSSSASPYALYNQIISLFPNINIVPLAFDSYIPTDIPTYFDLSNRYNSNYITYYTLLGIDETFKYPSK